MNKDHIGEYSIWKLRFKVKLKINKTFTKRPRQKIKNQKNKD